MAYKNPIYKQIACDIVEDINSGKYNTHQMIPSEYELARFYDVSRMTVRKSIDYLVARGYVCKQRGKGAYVIGNKIQSGKNGLLGFTESLHLIGKEATSKILSFQLIAPEEEIAKQLKLSKNEQVYCIKRVRYGDDVPFKLENTYINSRYAKGLTKEDAEKSIFKFFEKEIQIGYSEEIVEAVSSDEYTSEKLHIKKSSPVLYVQSLTSLTNGYPIMYTQSYYRSEYYKFVHKVMRIHE